MLQEEFRKIVEYRRSNRKFAADVEVPDDVVHRGLKNAILSPNSSNMQLWEFIWLRSEEERMKMVPLCMGQNAARTAKHLVVFVTRRDKWRSRAEFNLQKIRATIDGEPNSIQKKGLQYYGTLMPLVYRNDPFGIFGAVRGIISFSIGLFRPFFRSGGRAKQRIMVHKSCALAAQTFMLSIAADGYHTCPMEGFDEIRVKRALGLPRGAEICMIIAVGMGTEAGIWGPRYRVPEEEVVFIR